MRTLAALFLVAFMVVFACAQMPSFMPPAVSPIDVPFPTVASAAGGGDSGSGLARVTANAPAATEDGPNSLAATPGSTPAVAVTATRAATATNAAGATAQTSTAATATPTIPPDEPGALVRVTMAGEVGVLLDEFPPDMRQRVARALLQQNEDEWLARAQRQARLTRLRLNFRDSNEPGKGQLPLPQPDQWSIALDDAGPAVRTIQGHDLVMMRYTLTTTLLSDPASVAASEPRLGEVGGVWEEYFLLPADPDLLLQRTGRACINDEGFPPNSVDSENAGHFYDHDRQNCFDVLAARVGAIETRVRFVRVAWDQALADRVRTAPPQTGQGADLRVVGQDLEINRLSYRFVGDRDCALQEGAVGAPGWRRLLQFEATVHNVGDAPLHVGFASAGAVPAESGESVFEYAPCHDHVHYRHYGVFTLDDGELDSSKQAFCVQSTDRMSNHELSPLIHDYSCRFQGIQTGWVDEYIAGLDTQWIDVTDLDVGPDGRTVVLGFISNPEGFLCEGQPGFDENGQLLWEPSGLTTEDGHPILRPQCEFAPDWDANNVETREVFIPPQGSFVTAPCPDGEIGPLRNCDFEALPLDGADAACRVAQPFDVSLQLEADAAPVVVRACERSAVLGGIACTYEDALANVVVAPGNATLSINCPAVRDGEATGGNFALYAAPLWPGDELGELTIGN